MAVMNLPRKTWSHAIPCLTTVLKTSRAQTGFASLLLHRCRNVSRRQSNTSFVSMVGLLLRAVRHADARAWQKSCEPQSAFQVSLLLQCIHSAVTIFAASSCVAQSSCVSVRTLKAQERHAQWVPVPSSTRGSVQWACMFSPLVVSVGFEIQLFMQQWLSVFRPPHTTKAKKRMRGKHGKSGGQKNLAMNTSSR